MDKQQPNPLTVRLWREVDEQVMGMADDMYGGNVNATVNLLLMRALGFGDYEIEEECKKNMRAKK